jgi:hypothetical protein
MNGSQQITACRVNVGDASKVHHKLSFSKGRSQNLPGLMQG